MEHTQNAIEALVSGFSKEVLPPETYRESLNALVRLALTEYAALPIKDVQVALQQDLRRVAEIQEASRKAA